MGRSGQVLHPGPHIAYTTLSSSAWDTCGFLTSNDPVSIKWVIKAHSLTRQNHWSQASGVTSLCGAFTWIRRVQMWFRMLLTQKKSHHCRQLLQMESCRIGRSQGGGAERERKASREEKRLGCNLKKKGTRGWVGEKWKIDESAH